MEYPYYTRASHLRENITLQQGANSFTFTLGMGESPLLWSEFHPALYGLDIALNNGHSHDQQHIDFGMREFGTETRNLF